jgi:hypothetical protein
LRAKALVEVDMITETQRLMCAWAEDRRIDVFDAEQGPLFVLTHSLGPVALIRARDRRDAWEIVEDSCLPEAGETAERLSEEFGPDWHQNEAFLEVFGFRPNGPSRTDSMGHGVYIHLKDEQLLELTPELMDELGINLFLEDYS